MCPKRFYSCKFGYRTLLSLLQTAIHIKIIISKYYLSPASEPLPSVGSWASAHGSLCVNVPLPTRSKVSGIAILDCHPQFRVYKDHTHTLSFTLAGIYLTLIKP